MSIWTHVAGTIRFDGLPVLGEKPPDLGIVCTFEDDEAQWDKCNVPCGSEGSLIISLWTNPSESSLAQWTATIFGDLRDYKNDDEIIKYFNRIVKNKSVRQGCFTLFIEGEPMRTFTYINKEKGFMERVEIEEQLKLEE